MNSKLTSNFLGNLIAYVSLILFLSINLISITFFVSYLPGRLHLLITLFSVVLLIIREFLIPQFNFKSVIGIFIFSILGLLMIIVEKNIPYYLYILIIIFCLRNIQFDKLAKIALITSVFWLIVTVVSSKLGIIVDYIEMNPTRIRHYLGFLYSLYPSTLLLNIIALYVYFKRKSIHYYEFFILFLICTWVFLQTNSRLAYISSTMILLIGFINKLNPNLYYKLRYLFYLLIPSYFFAPLLSYVMVKRYEFASNFIYGLDQFLGSRIYLAAKSLSIYSFGLLGQNIQWVGNGLDETGQRTVGSYLYVDNLYIQLLQSKGLLFLIIFCILLTSVLVLLYKKQEYMLFLILSLLAFHASIDDLTFNLYYNFFLVLIGTQFASVDTLNKER